MKSDIKPGFYFDKNNDIIFIVSTCNITDTWYYRKIKYSRNEMGGIRALRKMHLRPLKPRELKMYGLNGEITHSDRINEWIYTKKLVLESLTKEEVEVSAKEFGLT